MTASYQRQFLKFFHDTSALPITDRALLVSLCDWLMSSSKDFDQRDLAFLTLRNIMNREVSKFTIQEK